MTDQDEADTDTQERNPLSKLGAAIAAFQTILVAAATALAGANGGLVSVFREYPALSTIFVLFIACGIIGGVVVSAMPETSTRIRTSVILWSIALLLVCCAILVFAQGRFGLPGTRAGLGTYIPPLVIAFILGVAGYLVRRSEDKRLDRQKTRTALGIPAPARPPTTRAPASDKVRITPSPGIGVPLPVLVLTLSATLFLLGCYGLGGVLVDNVRAVLAPSVAGSLTADGQGGFTLKASVEARGLLRNQHMLVRVDGVTTGSANWSYDVLFAQRMAPDENGNVSADIEIPIDPAVWRVIEVRPFVDDANKQDELQQLPLPNAEAEPAGSTGTAPTAGGSTVTTQVSTGNHDHDPVVDFGRARFCDFGDSSCLQFLVPQVDTTPQISTSYVAPTSDALGTLHVVASVDGLQRNRDHNQLLSVVVTGANSTQRTLATYLTPGTGGHATTTFDVPIPTEIVLVTVDATATDSKQTSPDAPAAHYVLQVR